MGRSIATLLAALIAWSWFAGPAALRTAAADPATGGKPAASEQAADDEPPFRCKDHPGPVTVTFKADTEVKDLVAWVMGFTCKTILLDPRIVATGRKVTIIAPRPMTAGEAYRLFLAALSTINLTVVTRGSTLRIVDAPTARKDVVPLIRRGTPDDVDQIVRYVYRPSYIAAEPLHQAFLAMKSDAGDAFAIGQILVITDFASNVREMLGFARLIDVPGGSDGIYTLPVRHADAGKLVEKLNGILGLSAGGAATPRPAAPTPGGAPGAPGATGDSKLAAAAAVPTKILVDERTNTLILASSDAGYQRVKALVDRLDVALEVEGGNAIHVYPLASAIADELAKTLTQAIGDGRGAARSPNAPSAPSAPSPVAPSPAASAGAAPAGAIDGLGAALEGQVRVIADPPTNSLIVLSSGRDFLAIKDVIKQLDLPRRQIYLEMLILQLDAGNDVTLGGSAHLGSGDEDSGRVLFGGVRTSDTNTIGILQSLTTLTSLFGGFAGIVGKSVKLFGTSIPSYAVLFQALAEQSTSMVVASQSIVAVDNVEAKYKIGTRRPVNHGTTQLVTATGPTSQTQISLDEFPLKLDVKPHISVDDMVLLEVKHESDELTGELKDGPTSSTRSLDTRVVVHDQETVVLSGLSQDKETTTTTKVPLLGDIPLLGYLFKTKVRTKLKSNLVILLTPYIIRDRRDLQAIRERKLREHDEFARAFSGLSATAYLPGVDYRKKRGLVEEINRAVQDVEREIAARAAVDAGAHRGVEAGRVDAAPATATDPSTVPAP